MINTLGPRVYQQPVVRSVVASAPAPQPAPQAPALPQAQSAGSDFGAMLVGFFSKLGQAVKNFIQTLFAPAQGGNQTQGVQSANAWAPVAAPAQPVAPPVNITPEARAAALQALPHLDILAQHVAMLKPTLDLLQVKKPSPNEILSFVMEAKIALTAVSQGQQPSFRTQTVGVADMGKDMLRFSTDTLGVVLAAKGLAGLFKVNDANFLKTIGEIESGLMSVRTAADILARNPV